MATATATEPTLRFSDYQQRVLLIPEELDVFLGGGRGGGKSYALAALALRHAQQYGREASILYLRRTYPGIADFEQITRDVFSLAYGSAATYNGGKHLWRLPGGARMELGQLEQEGDYSKFQGRSFTLLLVDEAGQYATPTLIDRLRSNLRGPQHIPLRVVIAANPGDVGHSWLHSRYVLPSAPWKPFHERHSEHEWVYAPSIYTDNPFVDQERYAKQIRASAPSDSELLRAWLQGDWNIARGAFFAAAIDARAVTLEGEPVHIASLDSSLRDRAFLAHDYGSAAPSITYLCLQSWGFTGRDGRHYAPGSLLLMDELAIADPDDPTLGLQWTVPRQGEAIRHWCEEWGVSPRGVADDAIFAQHGHSGGSIAHEFARCGVRWRRARKADRRTGWEVMRRLLTDAGQPDVPGLYVHRRCRYWWATVPVLPRDPKNPDDVDSRAADHAADATRYAAIQHGRRPGPLMVDMPL